MFVMYEDNTRYVGRHLHWTMDDAHHEDLQVPAVSNYMWVFGGIVYMRI